MFFSLPYEAIRQPGEFESAAIKRERDELWERRSNLSPSEGRRLDHLIQRIGRPDKPGHEQRCPGDSWIGGV